MRRVLAAAVGVALILGPMGSASVPAAAASVDQDQDQVPQTDAQWYEWAGERVGEALSLDLDAYARERGCVLASGEVDVVVNVHANRDMGAPAELPLPLMTMVLDCSAQQLAAPSLAPSTRATQWLAQRSSAALGGTLRIGKNGTWVEGEYTRYLSGGVFTGRVDLYKRKTSSTACSTSGKIANNIDRTIGGGATLLAVAPQAPTGYRYSAYLWKRNAIGSSNLGGVCTSV